MEPFAKKNDLILIKENPESIKKNDFVLWPQVCPVSFYWFSKANLTGSIPFEILKVKEIFQKDNIKHICAENGLQIPLSYISSKITKIIRPDDPLYEMFK